MSLFFCRPELNFRGLSADRLPIRKEHCRYLPVYTARVKRGWGGGGGGGDGGEGVGEGKGEGVGEGKGEGVGVGEREEGVELITVNQFSYPTSIVLSTVLNTRLKFL